MNRLEIESQNVEISLEIKSGVIVYDDSLGDAFRLDEDFDVNQYAGMKECMEAYGKIGLFHGFVGNSCPNIYQKGDTIIIGSLSDKHPFAKHRKGSIITDLWWYSLADKDVYKAGGGKRKLSSLKVTPGKYLLKHPLNGRHMENKNGGEDVIYATLELSSKRPKKWTLPEVAMNQELFNSLTVKEQEDKNLYLKVKPEYNYKTGEFLNYKATYMNNVAVAEVTFSQEEFKAKTILKKLKTIIKEREELHERTKNMVLSDDTKALIRKMLEDAESK